MAGKGRSVKGLFGDYIHYDGNGRRTGRTVDGLFGDKIHYDEKAV